MDLIGNMLPILVILALIATMGALATGIVSMVRGGAFDRKHSGQLMFTRVGVQGVAFVLLLLALFLSL